MGGADAGSNGAGLRTRPRSNARFLQSADADGIAHAVYSGRKLSLCMAENRSGDKIRDGRLPDYGAEGDDFIRTAARGAHAYAAEISRAIAGRRNVPDHAGPFCERGSEQ